MIVKQGLNVHYAKYQPASTMSLEGARAWGGILDMMIYASILYMLIDINFEYFISIWYFVLETRNGNRTNKACNQGPKDQST